MGVTMSFVTERGPDWAWVRLSGEIDTLWADQAEEQIASFCQGEPAFLVVDVEAVTFMDSTGLGFLATCLKACEKQSGRVVVTNARRMIREIIAAVGLDRLITLADSTPEVLVAEHQKASRDEPADPSLTG